MYKTRRILLFTALLFACGALSFCQQEPPPAQAEFAAASLGFAAGAGVAPASADSLSEFFNSALASDGRVALCPPERVRDAYSGLPPSCRDLACARGAAEKLSSVYILSGEVSAVAVSSVTAEAQAQPVALIATLTLHVWEARAGGFEKTLSTQCPVGELPLRVSALAAEAAAIIEEAKRSAVPPPAAPAPRGYTEAEMPSVVPHVATPSVAPAAPAPALQGYTEAEMKRGEPQAVARPQFIAPSPRKYPLSGAYGISVNWPGFGVRWSPDDRFMLEGKAQFATNNRIAGARFFMLFPELSGAQRLVPYAGADFEWVFSSYLKGGYTGGLFAGTEFMVTRSLGIGLDAGFYYVRVWNQHGNESDIGIIFNSGVTWYFGK